MKCIFIYIAVVALLAALGCSTKPTKKSKSIVAFYRRDMGSGSDNGVIADTTYFDYLVVTEYVNGSFTVNDFYKMAKKYIDTTKADKRICNVTFLGQQSGNLLPTPSYNNPVKKYELLSFGFGKDSSNSVEEENLTSITTKIDDDPQIYWTQILEDRKVIDSLLQSKTKHPK